MPTKKDLSIKEQEQIIGGSPKLHSSFEIKMSGFKSSKKGSLLTWGLRHVFGHR